EALAVDGASITLTVDGSPLALVASAGQSGAAETLLAIDATPCAEAVATGEVVVYRHDRVGDAHRFPIFSATATDMGVLHTMATPLRHGEGVIGMLSLMRLHDRPFDEGAVEPARQLAEVIVAGI